MKRDELITICDRLGACDPALDWLRSLTCDSARDCWDACERGDWMVWLLTERNGIVPDRALRLIAVDCARAVHPIVDGWLAQHAPKHVGAGVRLLNLIESDPDADPQTWDATRDAAWDAAMYATRAARDAARDAAASAARDAASAARDAASDAMAALWFARAAAMSAGDVMDAAMADQARIVRARVSWDDVEAGLRGAL